VEHPVQLYSADRFAGAKSLSATTTGCRGSLSRVVCWAILACGTLRDAAAYQLAASDSAWRPQRCVGAVAAAAAAARPVLCVQVACVLACQAGVRLQSSHFHSLFFSSASSSSFCSVLLELVLCAAPPLFATTLVGSVLAFSLCLFVFTHFCVFFFSPVFSR
jgi:hypothetical protein